MRWIVMMALMLISFSAGAQSRNLWHEDRLIENAEESLMDTLYTVQEMRRDVSYSFAVNDKGRLCYQLGRMISQIEVEYNTYMEVDDSEDILGDLYSDLDSTLEMTLGLGGFCDSSNRSFLPSSYLVGFNNWLDLKNGLEDLVKHLEALNKHYSNFPQA
jgi:hypothetical protein